MNDSREDGDDKYGTKVACRESSFLFVCVPEHGSLLIPDIQRFDLGVLLSSFLFVILGYQELKKIYINAPAALTSLWNHVQVDYWGEGETVEVAGSFNGWHHGVKLDPQPSSNIRDPVEMRNTRLWRSMLWLHPGIYELLHLKLWSERIGQFTSKQRNKPLGASLLFNQEKFPKVNKDFGIKYNMETVGQYLKELLIKSLRTLKQSRSISLQKAYLMSFQLHHVFTMDADNGAEKRPTLIDRKDNVFIYPISNQNIQCYS
ncbi:hypothetical protein L2E82_49728 [Cichorium intybus]|uniref:Uncharacterized protein n=1 Tax=Cichorium intybus TaxID=13427 RepID=A0ACB8Z589_CICIN|nr:hypothetical protein L2E82_49728 [Cichorium intybus]